MHRKISWKIPEYAQNAELHFEKNEHLWPRPPWLSWPRRPRLLYFFDCFFEQQLHHQYFISFRGGLTGHLKLVPSPFTWGHNRSLLVLVSAFYPRRISFAFLQFSSLDEFLVWWSRVRVKVRYGRFKRKKRKKVKKREGNELFN